MNTNTYNCPIDLQQITVKYTCDFTHLLTWAYPGLHEPASALKGPFCYTHAFSLLENCRQMCECTRATKGLSPCWSYQGNALQRPPDDSHRSGTSACPQNQAPLHPADSSAAAATTAPAPSRHTITVLTQELTYLCQALETFSPCFDSFVAQESRQAH